MMKKAIALVLGVMLLVGCMGVFAHASGTCNVAIVPGEAQAAVGETVNFAVTLSGAANVDRGVTNHYLTVTVPAGMEIISAAPGNAYDGIWVTVSGNTITSSAQGALENGVKSDATLFTFSAKVVSGNYNDKLTVSVGGKLSGLKTVEYEDEVTGETITAVDSVSMTVAGDDAIITIPCTDHKAAASVIENNVEPTCGAAGSYDSVVYCSICGAEMSRETITVPATGKHTPGEAVKENEKTATCGADGSYDNVVYCTVCKTELSRETVKVDATGKHTPGTAVKENEKAATCGADGSYDNVVYCTVCKTELSRENVKVDATGKHTPGAAVKENEKAATCEKGGSYEEVVYCTVCKTEISREEKTTNPLPHNYEKVSKPGKDCQTNGEDVYTCKDCGHSYKEPNTLKGDHVFTNKYGKDNKNHWLICDLCGEKGKSEEHSYIRDGGDGKLYCECGASTVKPADDGKDEEPKNGDITPYFVMPVVLVSVCAAAAYVTIKRKNAR